MFPCCVQHESVKTTQLRHGASHRQPFLQTEERSCRIPILRRFPTHRLDGRSTQPFGLLAAHGSASGPVDPFSPAILAPRGSLYVTRPTLANHTATRKLLTEGAKRLFRVVSDGTVGLAVHQTYALSDTATAHRDLESRVTTGASVLIS